MKKARRLYHPGPTKSHAKGKISKGSALAVAAGSSGSDTSLAIVLTDADLTSPFGSSADLTSPAGSPAALTSPAGSSADLTTPTTPGTDGDIPTIPAGEEGPLSLVPLDAESERRAKGKKGGVTMSK